MAGEGRMTRLTREGRTTRLAREGRTVRLIGHQAIPGGGRRHQVRRGDRINSYRLEKEGIKVKNLIVKSQVIPL
jgi:hypothetical protein